MDGELVNTAGVRWMQVASNRGNQRLEVCSVICAALHVVQSVDHAVQSVLKQLLLYTTKQLQEIKNRILYFARHGGLVVWSMGTQAEGHEFKCRLTVPSFLKLMCKIVFDIYHETYGEQYREKHLHCVQNKMVRVKFPIRTGLAREL